MAKMATNHMGPFVLTIELLPLLKATAQQPDMDVRVVTLSSSAHAFAAKVDWKSFAEWDFPGPATYMHSLHSYGTTKLANVLFDKELQRRFDEEGVSALSISIDPGAVATENPKKSFLTIRPILGRLVVTLSGLFFLPPSKGAWNTLFAATSARVKAKSREYAGAYLAPVGVVKIPKLGGDDPVAARDLWETSERAVVAM
ncbi:hypothetical protein FRB95_007868 [Tulasnella sp. JGI-2019a]|nr:hypothetical protein FRB95_007868 [Tulasnella sp. JGI-2019a]